MAEPALAIFLDLSLTPISQAALEITYRCEHYALLKSLTEQMLQGKEPQVSLNHRVNQRQKANSGL
jgi:hypothetical protein